MFELKKHDRHIGICGEGRGSLEVRVRERGREEGGGERETERMHIRVR